MILVTVTSPYRYRVQYINLIHYNMEAKRITINQAKKVLENINTYVHVGKFNLKHFAIILKNSCYD